MSCDHELAKEWTRCSGKNASYITYQVIDLSCHAVDTSHYIISPFVCVSTLSKKLGEEKSSTPVISSQVLMYHQILRTDIIRKIL